MALDVNVVEVIVTQVVSAEQVTSSVIEVTPPPDVVEVSTVDTVIVEVKPQTVTEVVIGIPGPPGPPGPGGGEEMAAYAKEVDFVGADVIYKGEAAPGALTSQAAWRIQKVTFVGEDISQKWAGGSAAFDKIWDNRASYTY